MKKQIQIRSFIVLLAVVVLCVGVAFFFCVQKAGYHEDEYYSYYSTERTTGLYIEENAWKERSEILREFTVMPGEGFRYGLVKEVQSWDVHPPVYYWVLHTIESFFPGVFSKWIGLSVNLVSYLIGLLLLANLTTLVTKRTEAVPIVVLLYGLSEAALSGVTFIRMYALVTVFVLWVAIIHCKNLEEKKLTLTRFYLPLMVCTYVGFLTQYYYFIFLFFLAAAFCMYRLIRTGNWKETLGYAGAMGFTFGLAYVTYPAFPGQMFHGQRGAQATASFLDFRNTIERVRFFFDCIDATVFAGLLLMVILVGLMLLCILCMQEKGKLWNVIWSKPSYLLLLIAVGGYFLAVSKTGLMLGSSSIRYQIPICGILVLLGVVFFLYSMKVTRVAAMAVFAVILLFDVYGVYQGNVLFLYKEDASRIAVAQEIAQEEVPVLYFYNGAQTWCVWDSTDELLQYPAVYFAEQTSDELIRDTRVVNADKLLVYIANLEPEEMSIRRVLETNTQVKNYSLQYQDTYCKVYLFE